MIDYMAEPVLTLINAAGETMDLFPYRRKHSPMGMRELIFHPTRTFVVDDAWLYLPGKNPLQVNMSTIILNELDDLHISVAWT